MGEDMDDNLEVFAERLKELRKDFGLRHIELVKHCNYLRNTKISQSTLSFWENLKTTPSIDSLQVVADVFGVTIDWLIGRSEEKYTESILLRLEPKFFPICVSLNEKEIKLPVVLPTDYMDLPKRRKLYSLQQRANVIFMLRVLSIEWMDFIKEEALELYGCDEAMKDVLMDKCWRKFTDKTKILGYVNVLEEAFIGKK